MTASKPTSSDDQDPVTALRKSLEEPNEGDDATAAVGTPTEEEFAALASMLPLEAFDPTVLAAVDRVLDDSQSVDIPARRRLVGAAERGIRWRRRLVGPLPPMLQEQRESTGVALATIVEKAGLPQEAVYAVERGDTTVDKIDPSQLAAWIRSVNLASATALAALRQSLQLPDARAIYAASGSRSDVKELAHQAYYDAVAQALDLDEPTE
jgi:hypothetical protein